MSTPALHAFDLMDEMGLAPHHLLRVTHGCDFEEWGLRMAEPGAVVRLGAPFGIQPTGAMYGEPMARIDPKYPVSVQVLDPLQRAGNNHIAARRRLKKAMTQAGFSEVQYSESAHGMHMVFVSHDCSVDISDWLNSVVTLEPDFVIDSSFNERDQRHLDEVQLPEVAFSNSPAPPSPARLEEFEARWKVRLPDDYCAFLLTYNGGVPDPGRIPISSANELCELTIRQFLSLFPTVQFSPLQMPFDLEAVFETQLYQFPEGLIPIAHCLVREQLHFLCLGIAGDVRGRVVLFRKGASEKVCIDVAGSVAELLELLAG